MLLSLCACNTAKPSSSNSSVSTVLDPTSKENSSSPDLSEEPTKKILSVNPIRISLNCCLPDNIRSDFRSHYNNLEWGRTCGINIYEVRTFGDGSIYDPWIIGDPQAATRPQKEKFTVGTADESREYCYFYDGVSEHRAFGNTYWYRLLEGSDVTETDYYKTIIAECETVENYYDENYSNPDSEFLPWNFRDQHPTSVVEVWNRTGALRSICLSMEEFPEARITGDVTVEAVLNKAEEVVKLYDEDFSLSELVTAPPTRIQTILKGSDFDYVDGVVEPGEGQTFAGYRITCYYGEECYSCYFDVSYNAESGWIYVYADKDVKEGINTYTDCGEEPSDNEQLAKVYELLTDEVIANTVNEFVKVSELKETEQWNSPRLFTLAHRDGHTIIELLVSFCTGVGTDWFIPHEVELTFEIPDGTDILKDIPADA